MFYNALIQQTGILPRLKPILCAGTFVFFLIAQLNGSVPENSFRQSEEQPITIALLPFENQQGFNQYDYLRKAIPDMLTSVLCNAPRLVIVERDKLNMLIEEMKLAQSGLISDESIQQVGKLVGARYVLNGSFLKVSDRFRIDTRIVEVETGIVKGGVKVERNITRDSQIMDLVDNLAVKIIKKLGFKIDAGTHLSKVSEQETKSIEAVNKFYVGLDYFDRGDYERAISYFVESIKLDPNYEKANHYLILAYEQGGRKASEIAPPDLISLYQSLAKKFPQNGVFHNYLGRTYASNGHDDLAFEEYKKAIFYNPHYATPYNNLGDLYFRQGKYEMARQFFTKALGLGIYNRSITENNLGLSYHRLGRIDLAEKHFKAALANQPLFYEAHFNLGNLYLRANKLKEALREFKSALAINPNYIPARYNLGLVYFRQGQYDSASVDFFKVINTEPDNNDAKLNYAACLMAKKQYARARPILMQLQQDGFEDPHLYENLGVLALADRDTTNAITNFEKVIDHDSINVRIVYNLARLYSDTQHYVKAYKLMSLYPDTLLEKQPPDLQKYFYLCYAKICEKVQDSERAAIFYRRVLRIDSRNLEAKVGIKRTEEGGL